MVILDADFGRSVLSPAEDDPPLVIDADGVKAAPIALQGLQPVSGWDREVGQPPGVVQLDQFAECDPADGGKPAIALLVEELAGVVIGKGLDHLKATGRGDVMSTAARGLDGNEKLTKGQACVGMGPHNIIGRWVSSTPA